MGVGFSVLMLQSKNFREKRESLQRDTFDVPLIFGFTVIVKIVKLNKDYFYLLFSTIIDHQTCVFTIATCTTLLRAEAQYKANQISAIQVLIVCIEASSKEILFFLFKIISISKTKRIGHNTLLEQVLFKLCFFVPHKNMLQ